MMLSTECFKHLQSPLPCQEHVTSIYSYIRQYVRNGETLSSSVYRHCKAYPRPFLNTILISAVVNLLTSTFLRVRDSPPYIRVDSAITLYNLILVSGLNLFFNVL